jgi:hypothetical protein
MENVIAWLLVTLVGSFGGSYLGAYFKKKGENVATHEDIDKLVQQVQAVTTATKEIEAKISSEVWDRQRRWELKRDVLMDATKKLGVCMDAFAGLTSAYHADREAILKGEPGRIDKRIERAEAWVAASSEFGTTTVLLVSLVCGEELKVVLEYFGKITRRVGIELTGGNPDALQESARELAATWGTITTLIRLELGVDECSTRKNQGPPSIPSEFHPG